MCYVRPVLSSRSSTRSEIGGGLTTVAVATMSIPLLISILGVTSRVDAALAVDFPTSLVAATMKHHESPCKSRRHVHDQMADAGDACESAPRCCRSK